MIKVNNFSENVNDGCVSNGIFGRDSAGKGKKTAVLKQIASYSICNLFIEK